MNNNALVYMNDSLKCKAEKYSSKILSGRLKKLIFCFIENTCALKTLILSLAYYNFSRET